MKPLKPGQRVYVASGRISEWTLEVEKAVAATRASIVTFIEAKSRKFEQSLEAEGHKVVTTDAQAQARNDVQIRLNAKASELRTIAASVARGDDLKGGGE